MSFSDSDVARQIGLFQNFSPARAGNPIFCHQAFLEKLHEHRNHPIGKRAALLLHRLVLDERRQYYKSTQGVNAGWRRSRLGGNQGSHFYAWWAPRGAPPVKRLAEFREAPAHAVFVRDIRHHDDHSELKPQSLNEHYLPITVPELLQGEFAPLPWTATQTKFAYGRQRVRIVKGYPGSGKTTALWQAAEHAGVQSILFVTFSAELAALARDYFDKFAPREKRFRVVTYPRLLRELLRSDPPVEAVRECRTRFLQKLAGLPPRTLGPWQGNRTALFDEIHAHLVGPALPVPMGRFPACQQPRLTDRDYRDLREHALGKSAVESLLETVQVLRRREQDGFEAAFFPELLLAWKAAGELLRPAEMPGARPGATPGGESAVGEGLLDFDCIAVDEVQDLTPVEAFVVVQLAAVSQARRGSPVAFLAAGDEAQTVRPTDFEWGWFHDLLHHRIQSPAEFKLETNVRSPRRIAELVNRLRAVYSQVQKQDRPRGLAAPEIDTDAGDQVTYCTAVPGPELTGLLETLSAREGLAIISLSDTAPDYVPEQLRPRIFTVFEAKGLDFHSVCILDPGRHLERIFHAEDWLHRDYQVEPLNKRLMIDQLRVAMSRPAERLYWLDVDPSGAVLQRSLHFLNGWEREPAVSPVIPAVVLKSLEEETLPAEERVRLCEEDARNFLEVKPEMAWNRAKQAVGLLAQGISDDTVARSARLTLAQISFCLAFRRVRLPAELGHPDLYGEAIGNAELAGQRRLAFLFAAVGRLERSSPDIRVACLSALASGLVDAAPEMEPWLALELASKTGAWLEEIETAATDVAHVQVLLPLLPRLYGALGARDAEQRAARARQKAIEALMAAKRFEFALKLLDGLREPQPGLRAACYEGLGDFRKAAEVYCAMGDWNAAIRNYRAVPDLDQVLELLAEAKDHPAAESLRWIRKMQQAAGQRPNNFLKVVTPQEMQLLQDVLEQSLGVTRKKRATRKTATAKAAAKPRTTTPRTRARAARAK